jgi:large subunit ribosomal protein L10
MNRNQKSDLVSYIQNNISGSEFITIIQYRGMSDKQLFNLRVALKSKNCNIKIAKNTLVKVAFKGTNLEKLYNHLTGPTAIVYAQDPVALSKVIVDTSKQVESLKIVTGFFKNNLMSESTIRDLAKLGSMNEVRASFIGLLQTQQSQFLHILGAPEKGLATLKNQ